jgi:hypothetical protein
MIPTQLNITYTQFQRGCQVATCSSIYYSYCNEEAKNVTISDECYSDLCNGSTGSGGLPSVNASTSISKLDYKFKTITSLIALCTMVSKLFFY